LSTKPITKPRWALTGAGADAANLNTPSSGEQDTGYTVNQVPVSGKLNFLFNWIAKWINFLDDSPVFVPTTAGANAVNGTGNGAGSGLQGTGGTTSGPGLSGSGGAPNGDGVNGTGAGTGRGVVGSGGATGNGVVGAGGGSGKGVPGYWRLNRRRRRWRRGIDQRRWRPRDCHCRELAWRSGNRQRVRRGRSRDRWCDWTRGYRHRRCDQRRRHGWRRYRWRQRRRRDRSGNRGRHRRIRDLRRSEGHGGIGVSGFGGVGSSSGVEGTGGSPNGNGVRGIAVGTGSGGRFEASAAAGAGPAVACVGAVGAGVRGALNLNQQTSIGTTGIQPGDLFWDGTNLRFCKTAGASVIVI
jgi:hypothetical protein